MRPKSISDVTIHSINHRLYLPVFHKVSAACQQPSIWDCVCLSLWGHVMDRLDCRFILLWLTWLLWRRVFARQSALNATWRFLSSCIVGGGLKRLGLKGVQVIWPGWSIRITRTRCSYLVLCICHTNPAAATKEPSTCGVHMERIFKMTNFGIKGLRTTSFMMVELQMIMIYSQSTSVQHNKMSWCQTKWAWYKRSYGTANPAPTLCFWVANEAA